VDVTGEQQARFYGRAMTPPPRQPRRFQFTLRKLFAFMLLCVFFFAYTSWWMARLRREQAKAMQMVESAKQREQAARFRAEQARQQALANLRRAQQALELTRVLQGDKGGLRGAAAPGAIRQILLDELRNPSVDPGALDLLPREDWRAIAPMMELRRDF
jgi:hypothetical protein